jgi:hypothetical protein
MAQIRALQGHWLVVWAKNQYEHYAGKTTY